MYQAFVTIYWQWEGWVNTTIRVLYTIYDYYDVLNGVNVKELS